MIGTGILSVNNNNHANNNATNGDSGHVSPDDQDDDQERYFDKLERFKRTETEVNICFIDLSFEYCLWNSFIVSPYFFS